MKFSSEEVAYAYERLKRLKESVGTDSKVFGKIGPRLRNLPSLYKDLGLVCTVAYLYGSAKENALEYLRTAWAIIRSGTAGSNELETLRRGEEEASYAITLALILDKVASVLGLKNESAEKVLELVLSRFGNDTSKEVFVERLVFPYTLILKKLSETMFKG